MAQGSLLDRMHLAMAESGRSWAAFEIAEVFLRMRSGGPVPNVLVRGMLAVDPRFREEPPGTWSAVVRRSPGLAEDRFLLAWIETADAPHPERWRVHLREAEEPAASVGSSAGSRPGPWAATDPSGWQQAGERWSDRRLVTLQPGALGRFLQWMSRRWGFPERREPLDLLSLARYAAVEEGAPVADALRLSEPRQWVSRWRLGPVAEDPAGVPLPSLGLVLDVLLERFGACPEEELNTSVEAALGVRPVPFERFRFTRADLDGIPEVSGIYRFYGPQDEVLYIGKALRLRRRVSSYFRPLPPEPGKRDELLERIRRLEVVPLPSELEALILESRGIRTERPPWNVQVDVHELEHLPPGWWWPLLFLAPGEDSLRATALLLPRAECGWLFHLPRVGQPGPDEELLAWLQGELELRPDPRPSEGASLPECAERLSPPGDALRLDPPEARLALRFFLREKDRLERIDTLRFRDVAEMTAALLRRARGPGAATD